MSDDKTHYVYRCYDKADRLLYVGCTQDVNSRLMTHRASPHNPASDVLNLRTARMVVVEYPTKAEGRKAEREAIFAEVPLLNQSHQATYRTPAQRRAEIAAYLDATQVKLTEEEAADWSRVFATFAGGAS